MFKKLFNRITTPTTPTVFNASSNAYTITIPATTAIPQNYSYSTGVIGGAANAAGHVTVGNITAAAAAPNPGTWFTANTGVGMGSFTITPPNHIIALSSNNQEIVRLNLDGSVTWTNEIDIDAAAEAFGQSLQLSAEMRAGISKAVKLRMRDSVFEDLINIAKEKGSLTAEDLTYLLEASKIVEKLKGGN